MNFSGSVWFRCTLSRYVEWLPPYTVRSKMSMVRSLPLLSMVKYCPITSFSSVSEIKEKDYKRLYSNYDIGGYLIFNDISSFVDSRADLFGAGNIRDTINFDHFNFETKSDFEEFLKKFDFDGILLPAKSPTSTYLADYGYKEVSKDENFILFEKMY